MKKMMKDMAKKLKSNKGVVTIEYALIGGLMAVAVVAVLSVFGPKLKDAFNNMGDKVSANTSDITIPK